MPSSCKLGNYLNGYPLACKSIMVLHFSKHHRCVMSKKKKKKVNYDDENQERQTIARLWKGDIY